MLINTALTKADEKLRQFNSSNLDAEVLLSFILKKTKEFLYTHPEIKLNWIQKIRFFYLINQRAKNWPIAYLTGQKEFYGRAFCVNKHVLVPRPLTEKLVDKTLKIINEAKKQKEAYYQRYAIADIGTGSGNIIITIIKELQKEKYNLDDFKFYATDISAQALKAAKKNARLHQVDNFITFLKGNLLKPLEDKKIDLILANLPYFKPADLTEPSIKKEPEQALRGNYDEFFKQVSQLPAQPIIIYENKNGINLL